MADSPDSGKSGCRRPPSLVARRTAGPAMFAEGVTTSGAPTGTTYNAVLSCKDASGTQKAELGHVETSVRW